MIGQTLDRYRIESKLGEGGMGVVYKAHDTHLDRAVAIKVLPPDKVADPDRKQRFVQEARAASALNHPNIITVHDIRSDSGIDFIVMEYAAGQTLDRIIPPSGLGVGRALRYATQIADALGRAHEAGIVHRDLKPSNVILTEDDRIKILDFGIAKLLDPANAAEAATRTSPLTEAGMVVGTAAYMSPEQAEGRKVDARSDIFSFGAVLYEMTTGRRPFVGDSRLSVLAKILNEDPAPPGTLVSLPADVERIILRCVRKDATRRYQTMADLKVAIEDVAADSAATHADRSTPLRTSRSWRWAWAALIPVVLTAAYFMWQSVQSPEPATPLRAVPLTSLPGVVRHPSFSPDGNHVTFTWTGANQDNQDVYVQQIGAGSPLRLTTDPANDSSPSWSPDGRTIAFLRRQPDQTGYQVRLVPPLGGPDRKLADIRPRGFLRPVTLGWCPDSSCLVVTDSLDHIQPDALFVVSTESGEKRQLTTPQQHVFADTDPAISPDGRWLVFRRDIAPFTGQLQLVPLGDGPTSRGEPRSLTPTLTSAYGPDWISNTEILFSADGALWRLGTSGSGTAERLPFVGENGIMPVVSRPQPGRPARLVYVRSYADVNVWRIETSGVGVPASSTPVVAISSTRREEIAQFSPDGGKVAFVSDRSGDPEIWVADASGANAVRLTSMRANPGFPAWSPDGKTIAFHSNPEGHADIFVVSADGGKPRNVTSGVETEAFPSFSHDGQWIYFSSSQSGTVSIWKAPASGGAAVQVSSIGAPLAIESSDGESLYLVESVPDRPGPLWRLPLKGGAPVKLVENVLASAFEVLDGGIYYLERVSGETRLQYFDFATRRSITIAGTLGRVGFGLTASRDGRAILYSRVDSSVDDLMLVETFR